MISQNDILKILRAAVQAPSGDNSQPWKFRIMGNLILVHNIPGRDGSLFNFRNRGDFVAHGALIENMRIAASQFGYYASIRTFPDAQNPYLIAEVALEKTVPQEEPWFPWIAHRATNRKLYRTSSLSQEQKILLQKAAAGFGVELVLVDEPAQKQAFARALSLNERLLLENRTIHDHIFSLINWSDAEEKRNRSGLFIETLELLLPQRIAFHLFRFWSLVRMLNVVGLPKFLSNEGAKIYCASGVIGALLIPDDTDESFIVTGRVFERVWLEATRLGLSIQPVAAVIYLYQRVVAHEASALSSNQIGAVKYAYEVMHKICGARDKILSMTFRIGEGGGPSARSLRREPEIETIVL